MRAAEEKTVVCVVHAGVCCGCAACAAICPRKCISMECDCYGFAIPQVDDAACVTCELCLKVCPMAVGLKG